MTDPIRNREIGELMRASLRAGHTIRFRAQGVSMLPAIWPGDVLTVAPPTAATPAPGDVALTFRDGRWTAHRVIARRMHGGVAALITRGDALKDADPAVTSTDILGIVVARNDRPLGAAHAARNRPLLKLTGLVARSAALLALTLKLRALGRRLASAAL